MAAGLMAHSIWKYQVRAWGQTVIPMPRNARVVAVQLQRDIPTLWALVDPDAPRTERTFEVVGTGWDFNEDESYIGTYQQGDFVWHVMERA
jgi:hypothetical protein